MEDVKRILVVSGMTRRCHKAVRYGLMLARRFGAELGVVHLVAKNPFELSGGELPLDTIEHDYEPYQREAQAMLDEVLAAERGREQPVRQWIRFGNAVAEVTKILRGEGFDLLVLAGEPEGRVEHYLLGLAREELLRQLPCSILLVREE